MSDLHEVLRAWIDDQMQGLPERRTPVAHGKAELLSDLRHYLAAHTPPSEAAHTWDPEHPCPCGDPETCPATPPSEAATETATCQMDGCGYTAHESQFVTRDGVTRCYVCEWGETSQGEDAHAQPSEAATENVSAVVPDGWGGFLDGPEGVDLAPPSLSEPDEPLRVVENARLCCPSPLDGPHDGECEYAGEDATEDDLCLYDDQCVLTEGHNGLHRSIATPPSSSDADRDTGLSSEERAELAVDGCLVADGAVHVEASADPADISVGDYQRAQRLHQSGDEAGLMRHIQDIHRRAYEQGRATRSTQPEGGES